MAIHHSQSLPFLLIPIIFIIVFFASLAAATEPSPPSPPSAPSPPPKSEPLPVRRRHAGPRRRPTSPAAEETTEEQLNHIIDALIGAGDFGNWAGIISGTVLPLSATIFVPENSAVPISDSEPVFAAAGEPLMLPYHVVPQRLTFAQLLAIRDGTRLPTLLPGKTLVVTNNSRLNFTIDDAPITMPDLYSTAALTVHGVGAVFDYSIYGGELDEARNPRAVPGSGSEQSEVSQSQPSEIPRNRGFSGGNSAAAPPCVCVELPVLVLAVFAVLFHWNSFTFKA